MVHIHVKGVPLQIVFGYSVLLRHWFGGSRRRFGGA